MINKDKIQKFCKATKAREVEVCHDKEGGVDFRIINGKSSSKMCARVKCEEFR